MHNKGLRNDEVDEIWNQLADTEPETIMMVARYEKRVCLLSLFVLILECSNIYEIKNTTRQHRNSKRYQY